MTMEDKLYLSMGIQKDPKEKNPIFYEILGRWKTQGTEQDCENSWVRLEISDNKKVLTVHQEALEKENTPGISKSIPFNIENANRTSISLTSQSVVAEAWEISIPTLTVITPSAAAKDGKVNIPILSIFFLTPKDDPRFKLKYVRCMKNTDMDIKVGEPVVIEGVDLSEALEKADQK